MKQQMTTLLLVIKDEQILLAQKKRSFGEGKFNGVGGKVEVGETIEEAMIRETKEEIGIVPIDYTQRATIYFDEYVKGEQMQVVMNLFVAKDFEGQLQESDEMRPEWFALDNIPFEKMFPDDKLWMPILLEGKNFEGYFKFDENFNLLSYEIKETV